MKGSVEKMLYIRDIEKIIENTLQEHKFNIDYEINNNLLAPMSFNVSTNTIKFNYLQVNGYIANINFKIKETDEDCVKLILYRQLGYYLAFKENKHDLRILKYFEDEKKAELLTRIETNAWDYGRTLVPDKLVNSYDKVREIDKILIKSY
ncbi:hypothetical protein [Neobacillus ginsengisoli]|uniref:Uncharacterized protein n=1 Tax=Neobacillus ginsengisoli TaxID=904295 RepID=A0ABT9Y098_9BACI|nr:hypothetical protein [Neobacillus ginsengisoli]MDQ0201058.1 hypothetical protein [Neobacillus ginsengisoli]